ncbi:HutD/Ves family protein [Rhizobium binxianense]
MRILRGADYKRMPWKNGGGETVEIAVSPEGAGLADFDWRVSTAGVAADGPFSIFPGIDRTLSILEGEGLLLSVEGDAPVRLTQASDPCAFPADVAVSASLVDGPVTDLNVMTRRSVLAHRVTRLAVDGPQDLEFSAQAGLLFCHRGSLQGKIDGKAFSLRDGETLLFGDGETGLMLSGIASCYLIVIGTLERLT